MKPISFILLLIVIVFTTNSCSKNNSPLPGTTGTPATSGEYAVFAWNDLGMHCLNPSYDKLVILPPYNNVLVQVVKRGNPPTIVTTGIIPANIIAHDNKNIGFTGWCCGFCRCCCFSRCFFGALRPGMKA